MTAPTRYRPACFTRKEWGEERCALCGAGLASHDSYDERLVWALDHPDTATAMLAAELLAKRNTRTAIDHLMPSPDPSRRKARIILQGETPDASRLPSGCRFHPRCPAAREFGILDRCAREEPPHLPVEGGGSAACWLAAPGGPLGVIRAERQLPTADSSGH